MSLILLFWFGLGTATVCRGADEVFPRVSMPERVVGLVDEALQSYSGEGGGRWRPRGDRTTPVQARDTNRAAWRIVSRLPWEDFDRFQRVRYRDRAGAMGTNFIHFRWWLKKEGNQLVLMTSAGVPEWQGRDRLVLFESADYRAELSDLLAMLEIPVIATNRPWVWREVGMSSASARPSGRSLLGHAVAAAWFGHTNEARRLVHALVELEPRGQTLWSIAAQGAYALYDEGLQLLRTGAPRSAVLAKWELALPLFPPTTAPTNLVESLQMLRTQIEEFPRLRATEVENPESLPELERVAYYVARFPDVAPAGAGGPPSAEDKVVAMGRVAVPVLLAALRERRLTRMVGPHPFHGSTGAGGPGTVLRVQDLALVALERITKVRFLVGTRGTRIFSGLDEADREALIKEITTWWESRGKISETEGRLSRISSLPVSERLGQLQEIQSSGGVVTNAVSLLKQWAEEASRYDVAAIAQALAEQGDMSLMPRLRELWRGGQTPDVGFVVRYGSPADYGLLRDLDRERVLRQGDASSSFLGSHLPFMLNSHSAHGPPPTNHLIVPWLVDLLDHRGTAARRLASTRDRSLGDLSMEALIALTGHNEGYQANDAAGARAAAIDKWKGWWARSGEAEFLRDHPEAKAAFGQPRNTEAPIDWREFPALVEVAGEAGPSRIRYEVPRRQLPALIAQEIIVMERAGKVARARFVSMQRAEQWFKKAQPLSPDPRMLEKSPLVKIGPANLGGPFMDATTRPWFYDPTHGPSEEEFKTAVEAAARAEAAVVRGAKILLIDTRRAVWFMPDNKKLLSFEPGTRQWKERRVSSKATPGGEEEVLEKFAGLGFESRAGDRFFPDTGGIHRLGEAGWSYEPIFQALTNSRSAQWLSTVQQTDFCQGDHEVYAWNSRLTSFWRFQSNAWLKIQAPFLPGELIPRADGELWVVGLTNRYGVWRNGDWVTGDRARDHIFPGPSFDTARLLTSAPNRDRWFSLVSGNKSRGLTARKRLLVVPYAGPVREIVNEAGIAAEVTFFSLSQRTTWTSDGFFWQRADENTLEKRDGEGRLVDSVPFWGPTRGWSPRGADVQGRVYLSMGDSLWQFDTRSTNTIEPATVLLPSMRLVNVDRIIQDSVGAPWIVYAGATNDVILSRFQGDTWKPVDRRDKPMFGGTIVDFAFGLPLKDGAVLFSGGDPRKFALYHDKTSVQAANLAELIEAHWATLAKLVPVVGEDRQVPVLTDPIPFMMTKDRRGHVWWAQAREMGVIVNGTNHVVKREDLLVGQNAYFNLAWVAPVGTSSRALVADVSGPISLFEWDKGRLTRLGAVELTNAATYRQGVWPAYRSDPAGNVWVNRRSSIAIDSRGAILAAREGQVCLTDEEGGLWFVRGGQREEVLVRVGPDDRELTLRVPPLRGPPCLAPDGTVWLLSVRGLLQAAVRPAQLEVVREYPLSDDGTPAWVWCDNAGRVWVVRSGELFGDSRQMIICYANGR